MHLDGMDLNLLVALDALLSEQSVTRAASRLCVTQPAMSVALQKLRVQFSDQLLERVGRRMEVTPFGQDLAGAVKELLFQIKATLNRQSEFDPQNDSRNFKLVMSSSVAQIFGVPALRTLHALAPRLRFHIDVFVAPDLLRRLQDGEIDLCIQLFEKGIWEPVSDPDSLSHELLFTDEYVLIADRANRLVTEDLSFEAFCNINHIETRFGGNLTSNVEKALSRMPSHPETPLMVSTYALAIEAVLGTTMTAIVPRRIAANSASFDKLVVVKPPFELAPLNHNLIWHKRFENDPGHAWLRNYLKQFSMTDGFNGL